MADITIQKVNNNDGGYSTRKKWNDNDELLAKAVNEKVDRSEMDNLVVGLARYKEAVPTQSALPKVGNEPGDGRKVLDDLNSGGLPYIWLWDGQKWGRTPFTAFPDEVVSFEDLKNKTDRTEYLNISEYNQKYNYLSRAEARASIPNKLRASGQRITYMLQLEGWINEQYIGNDIDDWQNDVSWKDWNNPFSIIQNEEFMVAFVDKDNRILWGIEYDANIYEPKIPSATKAWIDELNRKLTEINNTLRFIQNEEYLFALIDRESRVLFGIEKNGDPYFPKGLLGNALSIFDHLGDDLAVFVDKHNRILGITRENGEMQFEKLTLSKFTESKIKSLFPNCFDDKKHIQIAMPSAVAHVNIAVPGEITTEKQDARLEFYDGMGTFFEEDISTKLQGSSSLYWNEKNVGIEFKNKTLKVGDWVAQDSFHLKTYWTDAFCFLDIYAMRLWHSMRMTKEYGYQFPWQPTNDQTYGSQTVDLLNSIDDGARGTIDGFPIHLTINDEFYGLAVFRLKKDRANYHLEKNNIEHVWWEQNSNPIGDFPIAWDIFEIRNPKGYEEGVEPEDGDPVKEKIVNLWNWASSTNLTDQVFLDEYEDHIELDYWIDWMLWIDYLYANDCMSKNTQWIFYNNKIIPFPYDGDTIKGMFWRGTHVAINPESELVNTQRIARRILTLFKDKVDTRYKELRDAGIFSTKRDTDQFQAWTRLVGAELYKEDRKRWPHKPSNRPTGNYPGVNPYDGGFVATIAWIRDWTNKRINKLDKKYNYN